jgi:nickel/cobalt transporter (NiCoT) family protein
VHGTRWGFTHREWARLGGFGAAILFLHVAGWGLLLVYAHQYPFLVGLGVIAYTFGLRHAFDADHIAAIDNTTRKFIQQGKRSLGTGFFFSLGHSTIVFALAVGLALATRTVASHWESFHHYGGIIGASVSGFFLWAIGLLNLIVLLGIIKIYKQMKRGEFDEEQLEETLMNRGFMGRFFRRFFNMINESWHMYPLGLLFGLGFDTASEVGLLAITAGVASGTPLVADVTATAHHTAPFLAVLSFPILFAAGMSLMDTADGAFMMQAYGWAFSNPLRKVFYNITVTSLSVAVALFVGTVELISVLAQQLDLHGPVVDAIAGIDFQTMGYIIVGMFVVAWAASVIIWKTRRIEERWGHHLVPKEPAAREVRAELEAELERVPFQSTD